MKNIYSMFHVKHEYLKTVDIKFMFHVKHTLFDYKNKINFKKYNIYIKIKIFTN